MNVIAHHICHAFILSPSLSDIIIHYRAKKVNRFYVKSMLNNGPASKLTESLHSLLGHRADDEIQPVRPHKAEPLRLVAGKSVQDNLTSAYLIDFKHFVFPLSLIYLLYHDCIQLSS